MPDVNPPTLVETDRRSLAQDLAGQGFSLEETHISWVFLDSLRAYKVKKPVDFGFLDFTTSEKRRLACEKEVELNRRLAPGVYLGVIPVTWDAHSGHRLAGGGDTVDWAVAMVRLPAGDRGDSRLEHGTLDPAWLESLAELLASFHADASHEVRTARFGDPEAIRANVEDNFSASRAVSRAVLGTAGVEALEAGQVAFIRGHAELFRERMRQGRVRDGHGDLRLSQMYFDDRGGIRILDRIEFNDRFRYADVAADVAFLSMDLAIRGHRGLAERFLAAYARASGDYDLYALVDFFEGYRACVRGKIAGFAVLDPAVPQAVREAAAGKASRYFRFALAKAAPPPIPGTLIAIGGAIATGKSTLADALGRRLSIPVVDSDRTRKRMAGLDPLTPIPDPPWSGLYSPAATEAVYAELRRRAEVVLDSGRPVIVDASFRSETERESFRSLAKRLGCPFRIFECHAPGSVVDERLRMRAQASSVSDGRAELAETFRSGWQGDGEARIIETTAPLEASLDRIIAGLPADPSTRIRP